MNLFPFVSTVTRDINAKRREAEAVSVAKYEQKLAEYRETLENYKRCMLEYAGQLEGAGKKTLDNQIFMVQTALDLTYLKEQGEKTSQLIEEMRTGQDDKVMLQLENLMAAVIETNYKLDGTDKNVVNRLSDVLLELQKQNIYQYKQSVAELTAGMEKVTKKVKRGRILVFILLLFQLLTMGGIAFIILNLMDVISVW